MQVADDSTCRDLLNSLCHLHSYSPKKQKNDKESTDSLCDDDVRSCHGGRHLGAQVSLLVRYQKEQYTRGRSALQISHLYHKQVSNITLFASVDVFLNERFSTPASLLTAWWYVFRKSQRPFAHCLRLDLPLSYDME